MASEGKAVKCPTCGTDVMVTGFTLHARTTETMMRFHGQGAVTIASTVQTAERATCACCNAELPMKPVELVRAA